MSEVIGFLLGGALASRRARRRRDELAALGKVECWLRVTEGRRPPLLPEWSPRTIVVEPGLIDLSDLRLPVRVAPGDPRQVSLRETLLLPDDARVVTLQFDSGRLELAVWPDSVRWVLARLRGA